MRSVFARVKDLFSSLAIYGAGDVATQVVSLLLLPVYTEYLSPTEYGVIGLLLMTETIVKIVFRWGVDGSFMRFYYDCRTAEDRQRLASTIFWFLAVVDGAILAAALIAAPWIAAGLLGTAEHTLAFMLVLANTFIGGFFFIPFHVMRIEKQPQRFIALTFARSAATLVLRLALVIGLRMGVLGLWLADVIVTVAFSAFLWRWFAPLIRPVFSRAVLRETLRFGLPRLPHGLAVQTMAVGDRYVMSRFITLGEIGLYSMGASVAMGMKLFMSAFETAWAPFYFATMKESDAKRTFSAITTYAFAALVLLCAGLAAVSRDVVQLMMAPAYARAADVIPWIGLGVLLQGVYLLTSIGLNITKNTAYYPLATVAAAATSIAANLMLVPRYGMVGAAYANVIAYGVLAAAAMIFSQRFYPIRYEWRRLAVVAIAGIVAVMAAKAVSFGRIPAIVELLVHGAIVVAVFPAVLAMAGFFQANEREALRSLAARWRSRRVAARPIEERTVEMAGEIVASASTSTDAEGNGR